MKGEFFPMIQGNLISDQIRTDNLNRTLKEWKKLNGQYSEIASEYFAENIKNESAIIWKDSSFQGFPTKLIDSDSTIGWENNFNSSKFDFQTFRSPYLHDFGHFKAPATFEENLCFQKLCLGFYELLDQKELIPWTLPTSLLACDQISPIGQFIISDPDELIQKDNLFRNLVDIKDQLSSHDQYIFRYLGKTIDNQLDLYNETLNQFHLLSAMTALGNFNKITELTINVINSIRGFFLMVAKIVIIRDLRQSFRNMIRFLFKNMDDSSDDHDVLFSRFSKQSLSNFNLNLHDQKIYNLLSGSPNKNG